MSHPSVEDCGLHLQLEEFRVVRKKSRIQVGFDRSQVDPVVLKAGVIAHHQESQRREEQNPRQLKRNTSPVQPETPTASI